MMALVNLPLSMTVQAFGFSHSVRKVKYSSPIFLISKRPHLVPTSSSFSSSGRWTMVAPTAFAIRLLSVFFTLQTFVLMHVITLLIYYLRTNNKIREYQFDFWNYF